MGRDEHISTEAMTLNFFNKEHLFHVIPDDFPLPEDGIIGLTFFTKYDRYAITPEFLVLDEIKLPLHEDENFIPAKTSQVFKILVNDENQDVLIIDQELIPDGIYRIDNGIIKVILQNHLSRSVEVTDKIHYDKIYEIRSRHINHSQTDETWQRLQEILKSSNMDHLEPEQREFIKKLIAKYQEVFSLDTEPLPCTSLTEHEIVLKTGKIVNLRSHKLPEKHREFSLQEREKLLRKGIV